MTSHRNYLPNYLPRTPNENAEAEFAVKYPHQPSPWGQSMEMDDLIHAAQTESPASDSTFLGVTTISCTENWRLCMVVAEGVSRQTVELAANTTYPRNERSSFSSRRAFNSSAVPWEWNDSTKYEERMDKSWLVTFYAPDLPRARNWLEAQERKSIRKKRGKRKRGVRKPADSAKVFLG